LISDFKEDNVSQLRTLAENRAKADAAFMGMTELQNFIKEAQNFKEEIEEMHVKLAFLTIQIK